jgi:hypothetical protein
VTSVGIFIENYIIFGKGGLSQAKIFVSDYSFNNMCNLLQLNFKMSVLFRKNLVLKTICRPEYDAVWFTESQPTFRRNMSPPLSGFKSGPSFCLYRLYAALFSGLVIDLKGGGEMLIGSVS